MGRFILYLVLVPIVGSLVVFIWNTLAWLRIIGWQGIDSLGAMLTHLLSDFVAPEILWLPQALAVATADRLLSSNKRHRLATIVVVGCVSNPLAVFAFYGLPTRDWLWNDSLMLFFGGTAALVCCLLVDLLEKQRLRKIGSTIRNTIKVLRRWPNPVEE